MKFSLLFCLTVTAAHAGSLSVSVVTPETAAGFNSCSVQAATQRYITFNCDRRGDANNTIDSAPPIAKYEAVFVFLPDDYYAFTHTCFVNSKNRKAYQLICND